MAGAAAAAAADAVQRASPAGTASQRELLHELVSSLASTHDATGFLDEIHRLQRHLHLLHDWTLLLLRVQHMPLLWRLQCPRAAKLARVQLLLWLWQAAYEGQLRRRCARRCNLRCDLRKPAQC